MTSPVFLTAITYLLSLVGSFFLEGSVFSCAVLIFAALLIAILIRRFRSKTFFCWLFLIFALGFGYGEFREDITAENPFIDREEAVLTGEIINDPTKTESSLKYRFRVTSLDGAELKRPVNVVALSQKDSALKYGDELRLTGSFLLSETANPGSFDYGDFQSKSRLYGSFSTLYGGDVTVLGRGNGNILLTLAYAVKHRFEQSLSYLPPDRAALIRGIFFGDTSGIDHNGNIILSQSGIRHCFAVSGLHVGYVLLFLNALGLLLKIGPKTRTVLIAICLFSYAAITGFSPSVMRASIMCLMVLGATLFGRERNSFNGLGMAMLILLLWDPLYLLQTGFQLSFLAIFSILTLMPWLNRCIPRSFPGKEMIFVTVAAQIGMIPVLAYLFHTVSFVAFLISSICCLLVGAIVILCLPALIFSLIAPICGSILLIPCGILCRILYDFAAVCSKLPFAYIYKGDFGWLWLLLIYTAIAAVVFLPQLKAKRSLSLLLMTAIFVVFLLPLPFLQKHELEITFLSIGEGDAICISLPSGEEMLMDAGDMRNGDITYYTIRPFLLSEGINDIETVFLSHNDEDHSGAFSYLCESFRIEEVCIPAAASDEFSDKLILANAENIEVSMVSAGDILDLGDGVTMEIFWPYPDGEGEKNQLSLVAKMSYGDFSVLFTGDIEGGGLRALGENDADISADVLKIPHHGSKNSFDSDFYTAVDPSAVVISVGKNNYGHPDKKLLSYWQKAQIPCYRTDLNGAVTVTSNGKGYEITTYR